MLKNLRRASMVAAAVMSGSAFASGYEKAITWGGRSAGVAGIATPYIQGPQALYFNPAGLVTEKSQQVDFNISLLSTQFKGPIDNNNTVAESEDQLLTPFGLIYGANIGEGLGLGVGVYVSGGAQAKYDEVTFAGTTGGMTVETDLTIMEAAAGVGYQVTEDLRIGAAYRLSIAEGQFAFIQRAGGTNVLNAKVKDLEGVNALGFRLGAQYDVGENTQLGLSYRSQVDLSVKGKISGNLHTAGPVLPLDENNATAKTTFPQAVTFGVLQKFGEKWNLLGEYVWTQYSRVEHVTLDGAVTRGGGTTVIAADAGDLEQQWRDQHQVKLAAEYLMTMPVRFGYIWTSQVTHDNFARASFTPPGNAHTFTLGTGRQIGESFQLDGALDYTWVEGDGNGGATADIRPGKYETEAYALHLGVSYWF